MARIPFLGFSNVEEDGAGVGPAGEIRLAGADLGDPLARLAEEV